MLGANESKDIVVTFPYFQELDTPANKQFRELWSKSFGNDYPYITDSAATVWNGWHLWAAAVSKAGTTEREKVISALETGISYEGPSGQVSVDPATHHVVQNTHFARTNDKQGFTIVGQQTAVPPTFERSVCDLLKHPKTSQQFTPNMAAK